MKSKTVRSLTGLAGLAAGLWLLDLPEHMFGFPQAAPEKIYYGEAQPGATADAITLNVAPCEKEPNLQTISPYQKLGDEQASCQGGKKYTKVAVQALAASGATDKKDDKSKKQPPKMGSDAKEKSGDDTKDKK
jgi:hypothetical protein